MKVEIFVYEVTKNMWTIIIVIGIHSRRCRD